MVSAGSQSSYTVPPSGHAEHPASYSWDKASWIMELQAKGTVFRGFGAGWIIHLPHAKDAGARVHFLRDLVYHNSNRMDRFAFIIELMHRYGLADCERSHSLFY